MIGNYLRDDFCKNRASFGTVFNWLFLKIMKFFHHIGQVERQKFFTYRNPPCGYCSEIYSFEVFNSYYWRNFLKNSWYRSCYISFDAEIQGESNGVSYGVIGLKMQKPEGKNVLQKHVFFGFSRFSSKYCVLGSIFCLIFENLKTWRTRRYQKFFSKRYPSGDNASRTWPYLHFSAKTACFSYVFLMKTLPTCFRSVKFDTGTTYAWFLPKMRKKIIDREPSVKSL